jgi:hypothetical protein
MACWGKPLNNEFVVPILTKNNLQGINITPNGNCLFEALARHYNIVLRRNDLDHIFVRRLVVNYMRRHADDFSPYLSEDNYRFVGKDHGNFNGYLEFMSQDKSWGGNNEITAAFKAFDEFANQELTRIGILEFILQVNKNGKYQLDKVSFNSLFPNNKFGTILIYVRAPVVQIKGLVQAESSGSSGSHYDFACIPEWLMEPFCGGALKGQPFCLPLAAPLAAPSESVKPFADPNNKESIRNLTNRIIQEKRIRLLVVEYFGLKGFKQDVDEFILKTKPTESGLRVLIDKILLSRI